MLGFLFFLLSSEVNAAMPILGAASLMEMRCVGWLMPKLYMMDEEERCILLSAGWGRITR